MGWDSDGKTGAVFQTKLFREFSEEEQKILDSFNGEQECNIDDIMIRSQMPVSKIAGCLLTLEFDGIISALPGKKYRKIS
jgi:DNA processing protein